MRFHVKRSANNRINRAAKWIIKNAISSSLNKILFYEIPLSIENPRGTMRHGPKWTQTMADHYGFIAGTIGADGDEIDAFLGQDLDSRKIFVIDQVNPETREFDEHKVVFGFSDIMSAVKGYERNYQKGWTGMGHIQEMSMEEFGQWKQQTTGKYSVRL